MRHYLNDICKDCPKRTEDCHTTCGKYARELKKSRFVQRWEYDHSAVDRYSMKCASTNKTNNAKKDQRKQRYHPRRRG